MRYPVYFLLQNNKCMTIPNNMKCIWIRRTTLCSRIPSAQQLFRFKKKTIGTFFDVSINTHRVAYTVWDRCHVHSVDHKVPYTSLEWDVGSVGCLLYFCRNTTEEDALQDHWLVVGKRCLPLDLLIHLNCKRSSGKKPQTNTHQHTHKVFNWLTRVKSKILLHR